MTTDITKLNRREPKDILANAFGVSVRTINDYILKTGAKPDKQKCYSTIMLYDEFVRREEDRESAKKRQTVTGDELPAIRTWADVEKSTRVQKLEIEIQRIKGELIERDEHLREMETLADIVIGELSTFEQVVTSEVRDVQAVKAAARCVRNVRNRMAAKVEAAK